MISPPERENLNSQNLMQAGIRQVSRAITEEYVIRLQSLAYEDARAGTYGQGGHLSALKKAQWERCGSASQAHAVSEAVCALNKSSCCWRSGRYALNVSGQSYAVNIRSGANKAELLDENGASLSCFRKRRGSWQAVPSETETRFNLESDQIYLAAYDKAATELAAEKAGSDTAGSFDIRG
jgi:hypothetical protein